MTTSFVISRGTILIGDTSIHERPDAETLADLAENMADQARAYGHTPRVAILAFSNFGNPWMETARAAHDAVAVLDKRGVNFI